jgi:GT2 family glycosyltransferase
MLAMPLLAVIVVTHNSARFLPDFFQSWQATNPPSHEILLANSGSTDDTLQLAATFPAKVLPLKNIGYGAAINAAAGQTSADWLLLCNPDLIFPEDFATEFLNPMMDNPPQNAGCIAPGLVNEDDTGQLSVGHFPTIRGLIADQFRPAWRRKYIYPDPTGFYDWATGACLLIRRQHFQSIGGFDERFFLYSEEVDLQRRLAEKGLRTYFQQDAAVMHLAPAASRNPPKIIRRYAARGTLRYFAKHGRFLQLSLYRLLAIASRRLPINEALASRRKVLSTPTGP